MNITPVTLRQTHLSQFAFLRAASTVEELFSRLIPLPACGGALVPLAEVHRAASRVQAFIDVASWLDQPHQLALLACGKDHEFIGAFGLTSDEGLAITISLVFGEVGDSRLVEAAGEAARWLENTVYVDSIHCAESGNEAFWKAAGFDAGTYRSPASRTAGQSMILTAGPSISPRETAYAFDAARSGWNRDWSKYLTRFENDFARFVSCDHAMACSSGTGALTIALTALDIGPGDEVIVPDLTWVATANAVRYVGATPVFADIELDTWNIDVASAEALITPRTKAIMPVHMYGHPARMDGVMALAGRHHLRVVEDAAPAIGAEWNGARCGSFGDFAAFSFQGAKLLVTGEGGMLVCKDKALYEKALKIWDQGRNPSKTFWIDGHGLKYKMANIQAALGLGQLERCLELVAMKRRIFSWYHDGLSAVKAIHLNREVAGAFSIYWMSSFRLDEDAGITRDDLMKKLKERNIDTRPVFPAISQYPIWGQTHAAKPTADRVGRQAINLPSGVCLRKEQVDYVCEQIRSLLPS